MPAVANPYATHLGARDPREVISDTPQRLAQLSKELGPHGLARSLAPGKWSARMILCHLADCEIAFGFRLRQALSEPHHVIQPFDQDNWARAYQNDGMHAQAAVEVFSALRRWTLALLKAVPQESFSKPVTHPERGQMTVETVVQTMAGHDLNHLRQLETIASMSSRTE
jgi:hypothetical protein